MKKTTRLNKTKRIVRLCVTFIICLVVFCIPCYAQTYTEGAFYYELYGESITITGYFGRDAEITVPERIAGYPVNGIGSGAFAEAESVQVIHLPGTITDIGENAFRPGQQVVYAESHPAYQGGSEESQSAYPEASPEEQGNASVPANGNAGQPSEEEPVVITVGDVSEDPEGANNTGQPTESHESGEEVVFSDEEGTEGEVSQEGVKTEETPSASDVKETAEAPKTSETAVAQAESATASKTTSVEKPTAAASTATESNPAEKTTAAEKAESTNLVKNTGNRTSVIVLVIVCICAAAGIAVALKKRKRQN